ncbi:MAG: TRAP transporter small permease [Atribacterota bacterium]|nr:TRAP transporter small permease [Atribacterota bacterium]
MNKIAGIFDYITQWVVACFLGVTVLVLCTQVFFRYVLGSSITWAEELARYSFIWVVFLGASIALKRAELVGVSVFVSHMPLHLSKIVIIISNLIILAFLLIVIIYAIIFCKLNWGQVSPAMRIPMTYPYLAIPIGCSLMLFYTVNVIYNISKAYKN